MPTSRIIKTSACEGKVRHPDKAAALQEVRRGLIAFQEILRAYRCPHCKLWHTGKPGR